MLLRSDGAKSYVRELLATPIQAGLISAHPLDVTGLAEPLTRTYKRYAAPCQIMKGKGAALPYFNL